VIQSSVSRLDDRSLASAVKELAARDNGLARIVDRHGPPPLWARPGGFKTLVRIILEQQVSLAAAASLYRRLVRQVPGGMRPVSVLTLGVDGFRALGVTRQKSAYLYALEERVHRGHLSFHALARATDDEASRQLLEVPGIGPWTASIYLLMVLRRPDVWPHGDLALHKALARLRRMKRVPGSEEATRMAARWAPYRAVAARILWHDYLSNAAYR